MMIDNASLERHIGREQQSEDSADPERFRRLSAVLDRKWSPADGMPPLGHFLLFQPDEIQSRIGADGHPLRDQNGMLPAISLPRRMWAGSRIQFEGLVEPGARLVRRSRLVSAVAKSGKSGHMVFCTIAHEIRATSGGPVLISEQQDIVYREAHQGPGLAPRPAMQPEFQAEHFSGRTVGPVELFRYSALTFNAHRIHYDREYARDEEGYRGLVVQGPFLATMMFDHLLQVAGGRRVLEFSFRAVSPSFDGEGLRFGATIEGEKVRLFVTNPVGLAMTGQARLAGS